MKRLYLSLSATMLLFSFFSCNSGKNDKNTGEASADSLQRLDSLQRIDSQWTIDSAKMARLSTPDLEYCEVSGPVKSITYKQGSKYEFNRDGQLVFIDGYNPFLLRVKGEDTYDKMMLKRNSNGEINYYTMWESGEDYEWKNGKLSKIEGGGEGYEWHVTLNYDDKGLLRSKKGYQQMEDGSEHEDINIEYTYLDTDSHGNWIKRKAGKETEIRTITYFNTTRPGANDFSPVLRTYDFTGKIGTEKDCPLQIGPDGGYYVVNSGKKALRFTDYDPDKGELTIDAYKTDKDEFIGRFSGKLSGNSYKGSFINYKGGKVAFELTLK